MIYIVNTKDKQYLSNTTKCLNSTYTIINLVHRILNAIWSLIEMPSHSLGLGPPQLALLVEIGNPISLCGAPPQLTLSVEFLFEILFVGAPVSNLKSCYNRIFVWSMSVYIIL